MPSSWRWITRAFGAASAAETLYGWWSSKAIGLSFVVSAATAASSLMSNLPIWLVILVSLAAYLMASASILFTITAFRASTARHRLDVIGIDGSITANRDDSGQLAVTGASCILTLKNNADFAMSYELSGISLVINRLVEPSPIYNNIGAELAPGSQTGFNFHRINFHPPVPIDRKSTIIEGEAKFMLRYGRPGRLRFTINRHIQIRYLIADRTNEAEYISYFNWQNKS